jgi:thioredoxin-dependent peroxiredoxin
MDCVEFHGLKIMLRRLISGLLIVSTTGLLIVSTIALLTFTSPVLALGGILPALNQPAPAFSLPSNAGDRAIALEDYAGKWLVMYFYPADFTSSCTLEARKFQQDLPQYRDRNTAVIGISADDVQSHADFCDSEGLKFPLLADRDGVVSKAYGSWLGIRSLRHTFVIDPNGILRAEFTGVNPIIHSKEVIETLDRLQKAALS